ncbi:MAG: hypothetical protein M1818_001435 [Claussenomyces sp. TS43310]|nr:MAG: hypothetical protein M1818_001435 [Claussenomyces sp. TS43310]
MASTSVNRPTNIKQKEQDINKKLQLYGIFSAFSNGKVPSNEQIDIAMNSFLDASFMTNPSKRLSPEGQGLVQDFRNVAEQAKHLLLSKNHGNLLQDFIWQTQQLDGGNAALPGAPVDKETGRQHSNQALEGLRTLGTLIVSNGQFRKLLSDATTLLRDIAGDAATKAASKVNPSDEQLSQIDKPAEDNTWHDVPDMSRGNLKNQLKQSSPLSKKDLQDAAGDATQTAHPSGSRDPADAADLAAKDQQTGTDSGVDAVEGARSGVNTLKGRTDAGIDDNKKDLANAKKEQARNYLKSKMPAERREQTIYRLKKMIVEIQSHPDYQQAIDTLLELAETYSGHANNLAQQSGGAVKGAHADSALQMAEKDLKTLIERFANGTSADDLIDSIDRIYRDADADPELKSWFKNVDSYVRKCLKQQGFIMGDRANDEWNELYDRGNFLLRDRYRNHTDRIVDEFRFLGDQFDQDPQNRRFAESLQKLFNDLGNDENGKPTFKPHLLKDLSEVILPSIFENIRYVPVPRIEYSDPMLDAVVENLVIESDNLMPNAVEFASDNYFRWGRKNIANRNKNAIMISVTGVQMDLRDVSYYVKKKHGFPSVSDLGVADIFLGGSGFSFKIKVSTADKKDQQEFFKIDKVDVDVKNFNIKLKQSKHKLLFALAKPVMLKVMRPALQKVLEKVIKDKFTELDALAYAVKQEADRALAEAKNDPENVPNIYSRYVNAAQKKAMQGKQKTKQAAADKKVNVAVTQHDSIFPKIKLPGGISSKATEYKELASKGQNWESPVFSIGSAKASSNVAHPGEVRRKKHSVTQGGVRGPQNVGNTESMTSKAYDPNAVSSTQQGYENGSAGYANGSTTYGNGSANGGFSNQVDQAFSKTENTATLPPTGTGSDTITTSSAGHTTLGMNNPVLSGLS